MGGFFAAGLLCAEGLRLVIMRNMRWPVVIVVVAIAAFAEVVRADTCSSVASSTSIEIKQRFDLEYTSMLSIPASIKVICTTPNQEHGVVSIGSEVQERPSLSSAPVCTGKFDMLTPSFS